MVKNDQGISEITHRVNVEVCRLLWNKSFDHDNREKIVYDISPGPKPDYRCCVYKEREIVRQRIRLSAQQNADFQDETSNVVQVIRPACDDCTITAYFVTEICRFCLGKACLNSCKFGAIAPGENRMKIDPLKCKECGMCAKACPYGAILHVQRPCRKACPADAISYDEYGLCMIDEKKCVHCGHCVHACPFGAISSKKFFKTVIEAIQDGKEVYAMCAPAAEGQFGPGIGMGSIRKALKEKIGRASCRERV